MHHLPRLLNYLNLKLSYLNNEGDPCLVDSFAISCTCKRIWRTQCTSEGNKIIQWSILMTKEKSNEQFILTQIIHGKGEHICIKNKSRTKLQPNPWCRSIVLTMYLNHIDRYILYKLYKHVTHKPHSFPPILVVIPIV